MTRSRPLLLALLSGISGSGPSRSKLEASWPSAIDSEAMALSECTRLSSSARFSRASSHGVADDDEGAGQDLHDGRGSRPSFSMRPFTSA